MVIKSCDTSVDKVALIARWLVIHATNLYTINTRNMFLLFLRFIYEIRRQLCRYNWFNNTLRFKYRVM